MGVFGDDLSSFSAIAFRKAVLRQKSLTSERDDYRTRRSPSCQVTARLPVTHTLR
jgi:hypothetical protein